MEPKVLVACPTYSGMAYSLKQWADAYKAFTYENRGALMVDNTDENLHYLHLIRAQGIPAIFQERRFRFLWDTLELGWRIIVEYAHDNGYDLICSIEADVICPPETLDVLVGEWQERGPKAVVAHRYHPRGVDNPNVPEGMVINPEKYAKVRKEHWFDTLGCTLFPTDLMYATRNEWMAIYEAELYLQVKHQGYERVRLKDRLDIKHLNNNEDRPEPGEPPKLNTDRLHPAEATVIHGPALHGRRDAPEPRPVQAEVKVCERCGRCCTEITMHTKSLDAKLYWELHGIECRELEDGTIEAVIPARCERLTMKDGVAVCSDYEHRPDTCRRHTCKS